MSKKDAVDLIRTIAKEKGADDLARLPNDVLHKYALKMASYPLAIKWVVGQVALGKDINRLVDDLSSTSGDIARFCFDHIYGRLLSDDARMALCCLAASDRPLTQGVLAHVSGLQIERLNEVLRDLTLTSLVIQEQRKGEDDTITTSYFALPLTLGYLKTKLQSEPETWQIIQSRMELVSGRMEEAARAGRQYRYALQYLGATTDEERIAASWALTAHQRHQLENYEGAIEAFQRAVEIAPKFSRVYRNWAVVEANEGYYERANELMEKATKLTPDDPTLWFVWGNLEKQRRRLYQAQQYFQNALHLSPNDGAVLGGLGEVEKRRGNFQKADQYLRKALTVSSDTQSYRHEVITLTAIAENLRRWSEEMSNDKQTEVAIAKAKEAYDYVSRAVKMAESDKRARDTLRNVAFQLAKLLVEREGIDAVLPLFQEAIVTNPKRSKERKITALACYHLSRKLMADGRINEAKRYYKLGEKTRVWEEVWKKRYNSLRAELFEEKFTGKLYNVNQDKGYGLIERENIPGQPVFAHITQLVHRVSNEEFKSMQGSRVSFWIEETEKGPRARNIRLVE